MLRRDLELVSVPPSGGRVYDRAAEVAKRSYKLPPEGLRTETR